MEQEELFVPEMVEKQITDLIEHLQNQQTQPQTPNQRLINNLRQLSQASQADPEALKRARERLFQHLEERTAQSVKPANVLQEANVSHKQTRSMNSRHRKNDWRYRLIAVIFLLGILLTGTAAFVHSRVSIAPATVQRTPSPGTSTTSGALNIGIEPQPFLYQNDLYVVNFESDIRTYATQNGAPERTYALPGITQPTIISGILYMGEANATVAIRLSDGKQLWQAPFGAATLNPLILENGVIYGYGPDRSEQASSSENVFYALRANNGTPLWQYRISNLNEFPDAPLVVQGIVYFTSYIQLNQSIDARIYALKASNGTLLWHRTLGHIRISGLQTDGSRLYVLVDGSVEALRTTDGGVFWNARLPLFSSTDLENTFLATVTNGIIYVAAENKGAIYAVQASNGILLWSYQDGTGALFGSFSIQGNMLFVAILAPHAYHMRSSFLLALRVNDGHLLWQRQLSMQQILSPTVRGGVIYIIYGNGNGRDILAALRTANGTPLWTRILPSFM